MSLNGNYKKLIDWSCKVIQQKVTLMDMIIIKDTSHYTMKNKQFYGSSIGGHIRHSCDHYDKLLALYDTRVIQYDKRIRDSVVENDINYARKHCDSIITTLYNNGNNKKPHPNHPVIIEFMSDTSDSGQIQLGSDFMRELAFVTHHAIHHTSTIKLMMESLDYVLPDDTFGLANSTIRHKKDNNSK